MHIQSPFKQADTQALHQLIRQYPLATFIVSQDDDIVVNHFPLLLAERGDRSVLQGHVPRANTIWQKLDGRKQATAVFHGPQSYVTPSWYLSKAEHGRVVPTWNYMVVHAAGAACAIQDSDWLLQHLTAMTDKQEAAEQTPWRVADAPEEFIDTLMKGIVGIEMPISSIVGKWKLSQNRSDADRLGVASGLRARGDEAEVMASLVATADDESRVGGE